MSNPRTNFIRPSKHIIPRSIRFPSKQTIKYLNLQHNRPPIRNNRPQLFNNLRIKPQTSVHEIPQNNPRTWANIMQRSKWNIRIRNRIGK